MCPKNSGGRFHRMMEWVLQDTTNVDPYTEEVIIGSTGANMEEFVAYNFADVTRTF